MPQDSLIRGCRDLAQTIHHFIEKDISQQTYLTRLTRYELRLIRHELPFSLKLSCIFTVILTLTDKFFYSDNKYLARTELFLTGKSTRKEIIILNRSFAEDMNAAERDICAGIHTYLQQLFPFARASSEDRAAMAKFDVSGEVWYQAITAQIFPEASSMPVHWFIFYEIAGILEKIRPSPRFSMVDVSGSLPLPSALGSVELCQQFLDILAGKQVGLLSWSIMGSLMYFTLMPTDAA